MYLREQNFKRLRLGNDRKSHGLKKPHVCSFKITRHPSCRFILTNPMHVRYTWTCSVSFSNSQNFKRLQLPNDKKSHGLKQSLSFLEDYFTSSVQIHFKPKKPHAPHYYYYSLSPDAFRKFPSQCFHFL